MGGESKTTFHYWASKKQGLIFSTTNTCPIVKKKNDRVAYLGFTSDSWWPKKMNTGRVLHKKGSKKRKGPGKN